MTSKAAIAGYGKASDKDSAESAKETAKVCPNQQPEWLHDHKFQLYNDGSTDEQGSDGALHDIVAAIKAAQHFVFVVDWSFQPLFLPMRGAGSGYKWTSKANPDDMTSIGGILITQASRKPGLTVAIHAWNHSTAGTNEPENDEAASILADTSKSILQFENAPSNLLWRASSRTGVGWSHHQKFVVCDCEPLDGGSKRDIKVFFGGLDLTKGRFDWPTHVVSGKDEKAKCFHKDDERTDWYNAEFGGDPTLPRQPWHDIHAQLQGPAAWSFVREFVGRWSADAAWDNTLGDTSKAGENKVFAVVNKLKKRDLFIQFGEDHDRGPWAANFCHSISKVHLGEVPDFEEKEKDKPRHEEDFFFGKAEYASSIQAAYVAAIRESKRFIYIENQYFIGSGSRWNTNEDEDVKNDIPKELVRQIQRKARLGEPFHVYIILPMFPEGVPDSAAIVQVRAYEWSTIQYMATTLESEFGADWKKYLSFYFLANWKEVPKRRQIKPASSAEPSQRGVPGQIRKDRVRRHDRYMIYVHAKMMIVDDRQIILGSANINERSMAGNRDSEIACWMRPGPGKEKEKECVDQLGKFRKRLWEEHFFGDLPAGHEKPESSGCVDSVKAKADENYKSFRTMSSAPKGHICRWPFEVVHETKTLTVKSEFDTSDFSESEALIPDAPSPDEAWEWNSPGSLLKHSALAE